MGNQYILQELHVGDHGESRMKLLVCGFVWWLGIDKDVAAVGNVQVFKNVMKR